MATPIPPCYTAVQAHLSQGDIVKDICYGLIENPVLFCRGYPDENAVASQARYRPLTAAPTGRAVFANGQEQLHLLARRGPVIVLWEDCMIDKFPGKPEDKWFCAVAPVAST